MCETVQCSSENSWHGKLNPDFICSWWKRRKVENICGKSANKKITATTRSKKHCCWNAQISWYALETVVVIIRHWASLPHAAVTLAWLVPRQVQYPMRLRQLQVRWQIQQVLSFISKHHHRQTDNRHTPTANWNALKLLFLLRTCHTGIRCSSSFRWVNQLAGFNYNWNK